MNLDLRILNELRSHLLEVRILKDLRLGRQLPRGSQRNLNAGGAFELPIEVTQRMVTYR